MNVREKLVELLKQMGKKEREHGGVTWYDVADHLIAHGVTVQDSAEISDELLERLRTTHVTIMTEEPTIEAVQKWISVEDRLPEDGEIVTICTEKGFVYAGELIGDTWFLDNDSWTANVTHWMPLPKPPGADMRGDA